MSAAREVVGVVGGTFDPVHLGHLHIARQVARVFTLGRVLLVPCASPPHKPHGPVASAADRLEMVRLAVREEPALEACSIEVDRGGVSYTIDTLDALRAQGLLPLFVLGIDSVDDLTTWRDHERLLREYDLVAVDRPGSSSALSRLVTVECRAGAGGRFEGAPAGHGGRIFHLPAATLDVSSSAVRARSRAGKPILDLVPAAVARYIQEHGLYA